MRAHGAGVVAGCGGRPSYTGTYQGGFFVSLTPTPLTGDPTASGTTTLVEASASVSGSFDVMITANGNTSTSTGTMSGTVGGDNGIGGFTIVVDKFAAGCTPPMFTASGSASLGYDSAVKSERLSRRMLATVRNASNAAGRSGDQEFGMEGQMTPEFSLRENSDVVPPAEKIVMIAALYSARGTDDGIFRRPFAEKFRRLRLRPSSL